MKSVVFVLMMIVSASLFAQETEMQKFHELEKRSYQKLMTSDANRLASTDDYDALYYKIDVSLRKDADSFSGNVLMQLKSVIASLQQVDLNFSNNATTDSVFFKGNKVPFTHAGNVLSVRLPSPAAVNDLVTIQTFYHSPIQGSAFTKAQRLNADQKRNVITISTQAEPFDARKWWPCKDDTRDKADSVDVFITIDNGLQAISNGTLISDVSNPDSTHTAHWAERYPITTYLVSVAAAEYNYKGLSFTHGGKTMPVIDYYFTRDSTTMRAMEKYMLDGLKIYSDLFITYPFIKEKYGMAEYVWGGAMEHQTCTSMGFYGEGVVVHELSHQWFGDKVTCAGFEHIWLNEGWATYCEALYFEAKGGLPALKQDMNNKVFYGPGTIYVENPLTDNIFDGNLSYNKGSWVLHMMRHAVGDSGFFRGVRNYLGGTNLSTYRSATTQEFQSYIEAASGYKLDNFIRNWIYGEYYPTYKYDYAVTPQGNQYKVDVTIQQMYVPQRQIFDLPIDLTFRIGNKDTTFVVRDSTEFTTFSIVLPFQPDVVLLDKDNWILKKVVTPIVNPTFDKGILLVNGIDWDVSAYTADTKSAYADSIFTGNHSYTFWDLFPNPSTGYPNNITKVLGSGDILPNIFGQYCTVVWIGNEYNGDDTYWGKAPIDEYLKAGGNVILLTRQGTDFIDSFIQDFLGVTWTSNPLSTFNHFKAQQPGLVDIGITDTQDRLAACTLSLSRPENKILFADTVAPDGIVGTAVWGKPKLIDGKMSGNFIFMSMRPYRVEHTSMRRNMEYLLSQISCVPQTGVENNGNNSPVTMKLNQNYPNPFGASTLSNTSSTMIDFYLPSENEYVTLTVYDFLGREVRTLVQNTLSSGAHQIRFDARDLPSGIYYYKLTGGSNTLTRRMILMK